MERHVRARWRGSHACALPPAGRMCVRLGAGAASTTRWRYQPVDAASAGSCQKSRSQIGSFFFFPPQGQGFRPSPSCHRHAAHPPPSRRGIARLGSVPPSRRPAAGLHLLVRAAALHWYHPALPPRGPQPVAKTLFNITKTFIV